MIKIRFKFITLILINLSIFECDKAIHNTESEIFTLTGYVFEANSNPLIPVAHALVTVGSVYDYTDSTGYFIIDDILGKKGVDNKYVFEVTKIYYDTLFENVILNSSSTKNFYLVKKVDFFPLALGNYWKFDYNRKEYHMNYYSEFSGQMEWEITKIEMSITDVKYLIAEILTGRTNYDEGPDGVWDTTYVSQFKTYFRIQESSGEREMFLDVERHNELIWPLFEIDRYQSPTIGDTLVIGNNMPVEEYGSYYIEYVKNIGPIYFHRFGHSYHIREYEKATLVNYKLNETP